MVSVGNEMYQVITRGNIKFFISNEFINGVDVDKDTDDILSQMSDFVMEFKKCKDCSVIGEWFLNKGGKDVV